MCGETYDTCTNIFTKEYVTILRCCIHANQSPATHVFVTLFKQSICLNRLNAPKIETFYIIILYAHCLQKMPNS